jgi:hypothetical protein
MRPPTVGASDSLPYPPIWLDEEVSPYINIATIPSEMEFLFDM